MTDEQMVDWLSKRSQLGEVPVSAYNNAHSAFLSGRSDIVRAVYGLYAPLSDEQKAGLVHVQAEQLRAEVDRLKAERAAYREIVEALANEAYYQRETGEGSMAYLARLIMKAKALLASENAE